MHALILIIRKRPTQIWFFSRERDRTGPEVTITHLPFQNDSVEKQAVVPSCVGTVEISTAVSEDSIQTS